MSNTYTEKDMVEVVDEAGNDLPPVPSAWFGTDLLPAGVKKASSRSKSSSSSLSGSDSDESSTSGDQPAGNASTDEWIAYARTQGATDDDLVDDQGEPLGRDAIREKYGTSA